MRQINDFLVLNGIKPYERCAYRRWDNESLFTKENANYDYTQNTQNGFKN